MPLMNQSLPLQYQGSSAGKLFYPVGFSGVQYNQIGDFFNRENLTPTNAWTLYTALANAGSGTATLNGSFLIIATSATGNDDVDVRTSGISFDRAASFSGIDLKAGINMDIIFQTTTLTNVRGFIGLINGATTNTTDIPTISSSMGIYWDTSVDTHYWLTSGDGSTQTKTDTGQALSASGNFSTARINILWNGTNSGIISFYSTPSNGYGTLVSSQTVSALGGVTGMKLHFYERTLTTAAATLKISEWAANWI